MTPLRLGKAMRDMQGADPASVVDVLTTAARDAGASDLVMYLVDFGHTSLEPVPDGRSGQQLPPSEPVAASMAGRAFLDQLATTADRAEGARIWVPIVEGSDRAGVLAITVPTSSDATINICEELGMFAGYLIATHRRVTDLFDVSRQRRALSVPATMQWDLLPPLLLKTERLSVAGLVEPAYDVGGDSFDYGLNGSTLNVAMIDAMGHGIESALIAALTIGTYRHDRRANVALDRAHNNLDAILTDHGRQFTFATGQLAQIDLDTGTMTWTNAGHPLPLLIRRGRVIREMECPPTPPWGLGSAIPSKQEPTITKDGLEPGDSVLFYTDGVTEAHSAGGEQFGVERLMDLVGQYASDQIEPEEIIRRLVRSVRDHRDADLADDATLVLVEWKGP